MASDRQPLRTTRCRIPGHGTRCEVAREQIGSGLYARPTERALVLAYEEAAEEGEEGRSA